MFAAGVSLPTQSRGHGTLVPAGYSGASSQHFNDCTMTRVKICGVTTPDDVRLAADAGADAIGLNFYPQSPRYVAPPNAAPLLRALPPFVDAVGVFVGLKIRQISAIANPLGLSTVQTFADPDDPADSFPFRLIAAFRVKDGAGLDEVTRYLNQCREAGILPRAVLIDAHVEGQFGGTGKAAPWELLVNFRPGVPLILAGGLTPDNVAAAIRIVRPWAVDVASGVELSPGRKDPDKVRRFIENVRNAEFA
jgi:phosphoribosylanthranilate isomerase